jgi:hypothetical protein
VEVSVIQPPREQRHTDMKAAILLAAQEAILEHGPERFSLRNVARRSGRPNSSTVQSAWTAKPVSGPES